MISGRRLVPIFITAALLALSDPRRVEAGGWSATFDSGTGYNVVDAVYPTADSGYLVSSELWRHLSKLSATGEVIWSRKMTPYGAARELLVPTGDGFLVLGYRTLARLNGLGDVVWWRRLDSLNPSLARTWSDGTFLISAVHETGDRPFIAKFTSSGQVLWRMFVDLPVLSSSDIGWVRDLLPLDDGSFFALMTTLNYQSGESHRSADYVVRFSADGAMVWARVLVGLYLDQPQSTGVSTLGKAAGGGYFAYGSGSGTLVALDSVGNVKSFRSGLPASDHGIRPTIDGGYIVVGLDNSTRISRTIGPLVQKLDRQLNSEWVRKFPSSVSVFLNSIAATPAGGWILGGQTIPPGQSNYYGWIFRLSSGGQPFGNCPASELVESDLGNGRQYCEVQLTYPSSSTSVPIATVTNCDPPPVPPGFGPVRQDFAFICGPGALPNEVQCTVTTRNNYSGTFYVSARDGSGPLYVGPNASASIDLIYRPESPPGTYLIEVTTGANTNITSAPASVSIQPGLALTSEPTPVSWLPFNLSRSLLCSGESEICPLASALDGEPELDSDGDSLSDRIERCGVTDPETGEFLDLPALEADPLHKDVFVEVDFLKGLRHDHKPQKEAIDLAVQAFANMPVSNPDGKFGVNLHVDYGQWKNTESNPFDDHDGDFLTWELLDELKDRMVEGRMGFSKKRRNIFHYCVFGHKVSRKIDGKEVFGKARPALGEEGPGADFVVTLGYILGDYQREAGVFVHELGHNLGLEHGGGDSIDCKPNYRSVMNTCYTNSDLLRFSKFPLPPVDPPLLDERQLDERKGIGTELWTLYRCPPKAECPDPEYTDKAWCKAANRIAIDWNCNTELDEQLVYVNINGDSDPNERFLRGFADDDNWVDFSGIRPQLAGLAASSETEPSEEPRELTLEEDRAIPKPVHLFVEAVSPVVKLAWGETRHASFRISNLGAEDDTYDLFAYSTAGHALGGAPGPITPTPIALDGGESALVEIAVTAPPTGMPHVSDLVLIVTGRRRPELADEVSIQIAAGSSGPLSFYTLSPCRVADTRPASALHSGLLRIFPVGFLCGIPPSARAIAANVTVVQPSGYGYVTLFPAGQSLPDTSTINFGPGQVRANNAILQLGDDAGLAALPFLADGGVVHLIIDVLGYFE